MAESWGSGEWLETDGAGGYACGTASGIRTRKYHSLLTAARQPPTQRYSLLQGIEAWVETDAGRFAITSHMYGAGRAGPIVAPDGSERLRDFRAEPWPTWRFRLEDGTEIEQSLFLARPSGVAALSWRVLGRVNRCVLSVRPLLSVRDHHSLHHENPHFQMNPLEADGGHCWRPYPEVPGVRVRTNGVYRHEPVWYRDFHYSEEERRGYECREDLAAPGVFTFDLAVRPALLLAAAERDGTESPLAGELDVTRMYDTLRTREEARRRAPKHALALAAEHYVVRRGAGHSIVAGYPWFGDWGRDTFISLRGLLLATGELDTARSVLIEWARQISDGMLPNRFPDGGEEPEYNSVDSALWYVIAAGEYLERIERMPGVAALGDRRTLGAAIHDIVTGYERGTRHGIRACEDGLLAAGEPGVQLTWMDAKIGDHVVTPRIGKPVEVNALWVNALEIAARADPRWMPLARRARAGFDHRFWNEETGTLYDVVDVDHIPGAVDASIRPNALFAVGGLPLVLLDPERAQSVVECIEARLWTPLGPRTLATDDPRYRPSCAGEQSARDLGYHQGTVWPWLTGAFVEAWLRTHENLSTARKRSALHRFLDPLVAHLGEAGLGHITEIADGDAPHAPRGCPFQAWSVAELLRVVDVVLPEHGIRWQIGAARGGGEDVEEPRLPPATARRATRGSARTDRVQKERA